MSQSKVCAHSDLVLHCTRRSMRMCVRGDAALGLSGAEAEQSSSTASSRRSLLMFLCDDQLACFASQPTKTAGRKAKSGGASRAESKRAEAAALSEEEEEDPDDPMQEGVLYEVRTRREWSMPEHQRRIVSGHSRCKRESTEPQQARLSSSARGACVCSGPVDHR